MSVQPWPGEVGREGEESKSHLWVYGKKPVPHLYSGVAEDAELTSWRELGSLQAQQQGSQE